MILDLAGARVVVAGGSEGIGIAIAKAFADEGATPWLTGRSAEKVRAASDDMGGAPSTVGDLTHPEVRARLVSEVAARWSLTDCLVLNFGPTSVDRTGLDATEDDWWQILDSNLVAHASLLRDFRPLLARSTRASVVAISSIAGQTRLPAPPAYSAAKAALDRLCLSAVPDLARDGIRINVIAPGNIRYPGGRWDKRSIADPDGMNRMLEETVPLRRFGSGAEIGAFAVFLASARAAFCTGAIIRVDGGQSPT